MNAVAITMAITKRQLLRSNTVLATGRLRAMALAAVAVMVLMVWVSAPAYAADTGDSAVLKAVDIGSLPGGRVQLRFQMSGPVADPRSFTVNDPARIVLDFVGVRNGLSAGERAINQGVAERVIVLEGNDRTRASVNLARLVPYSVRAEGSNVLLTLEAGSSATIAPPPTSPGAASSPTAASEGPIVKAPRVLSGVDFRRGPQGQGLINITLSDPTITVDVREEGGKIIADFGGATLPRGQERRLDVTDFATPVTMVDAVNRGANARVTVQKSGQSEFLAYQSDNRYTIEVKPVIQEKSDKEDPTKKVYSGELLSLNFQDIEVRAVLQIIADFTGLNVVVSDTVQGNLTLRLQNVPWDQALDIILQTKGLTQRRSGNVIYVAPAEEVAAREKLELEAQKQRTELIPVRSEIVQVNYAKAEDLAKLIKERSAGGKEGSETSLLSARGQVTADPRTNSLLVQDIPDKLVELRDLITRLDVPVRQVQIDSRIVIANDDFSRQLGVRFGGASVRRNGADGVASISGSLGATDVISNSAAANLQNNGQPFPVTIPLLNDRLGVNLGVGGPFGSLAFAILGRDYLLDLELSALQAEGRGETISNPRVITTDRKEASVKQGQEIPFQSVDDKGNPKTEFRDAVLELKVTPQITPDGRIIMDLLVKKDEPSIFNQTTTITKRELSTQVLVNNGETVVLGGIFEKVSLNNTDKVPLLGDLPAIGRLFQRRINRDNKLELLIFITPQIVTEGIAVR